MGILRATVILKTKSGKTEDEVRNVWHVEYVGVTPAAATISAVGTRLSQFMQNGQAYLGRTISTDTNAHRVELATVAPGGAGPDDDQVSKLVGTVPFTLGGINQTLNPLPSEVAIAVSFRGDIAGQAEELGFTRPASRRRGRVFFGPLNTSVLDIEATTMRPRVSQTVRDALIANFGTLVAGINGTGAGNANSRIVVYSRMSAGVFPVVEVSVDDAFDTQRRRGEDRAVRTTQVVTQQANV